MFLCGFCVEDMRVNLFVGEFVLFLDKFVEWEVLFFGINLNVLIFLVIEINKGF